MLNRVATMVSPDTIMRWHERLIAAKWTDPRQRHGQRAVKLEVKGLVVRFAKENSSWGYSPIQGALKDLGHQVGRTTISRILKAEGIKPAPDRSPDESFMAQVGRNLIDTIDGFLLGRRFLICDRDTKFTKQFKQTLNCAGVEIVLTPHRAPNRNAFAERFVRSIKEECLGRMIFFGEAALGRALREYVAHYNTERPHQGLGNRVIVRPAEPRSSSLRLVTSHERPGGLLRHYRVSA